MVIVLRRNPSVELVLGDEDMRLPEPGLALLVGGGADAVYSSGGKLKKWSHKSRTKAASSSPMPLMPCCRMNAGSQLWSESCKARMTDAIRKSFPGCKLARLSFAGGLALLAQSRVPFLQRGAQCCPPRLQSAYVLVRRLPRHPRREWVLSVKEECLAPRLISKLLNKRYCPSFSL